MNDHHTSALLVAIVVFGCGAVADAADRVRAGEWETTVSVAGRTMTKSACISESDAAALNGDVASIRTFVEKSSAKNGCKVTDVTVSGNQVVVTNACAGGTNVGTTTYRGDTFETVNTNGARASVKRVGDCK